MFISIYIYVLLNIPFAKDCPAPPPCAFVSMSARVLSAVGGSAGAAGTTGSLHSDYLSSLGRDDDTPLV